MSDDLLRQLDGLAQDTDKGLITEVIAQAATRIREIESRLITDDLLVQLNEHIQNAANQIIEVEKEMKNTLAENEKLQKKIGELEDEIKYRREHTGDLIQDRDECKLSMVHYALDLKEAKRRIRELESACYRLTEERDRLKGWADKYHDEALELRKQIEERE